MFFAIRELTNALPLLSCQTTKLVNYDFYLRQSSYELIQTFSPTPGSFGDVHFDDEETFTVKNQPGGVDLNWLALHELGHSLGLEHSSNKRAIMYPIYRGYHPGLQLHRDDVMGIQQLYGKCLFNLVLCSQLLRIWWCNRTLTVVLGSSGQIRWQQDQPDVYKGIHANIPYIDNIFCSRHLAVCLAMFSNYKKKLDVDHFKAELPKSKYRKVMACLKIAPSLVPTVNSTSLLYIKTLGSNLTFTDKVDHV